MIYVDEQGRGYFHGDQAEIIDTDRLDGLVEFRFLEGHRRGETFHQNEQDVEAR